ncbi:nucleoside diphosphate kinase 1-like [Phalaenopsis equestris]|uniref:nucleoside diphosphate kinase 1-like n=1 Tax=Phalaenopsis equestris TaxID=78828 RepID=UPI0009E20067|nr:nucleoside diphosphate kinase 1-like [Phalaenopsis equestris]
MEQTFIMIKPDGVHRNLITEIMGRFECSGFCLKGLKFLKVERSIAEKHYEDLAGKHYFPALVGDITSSPVVAMIWEGDNVIVKCRKIIGASDPSKWDDPSKWEPGWEPGTVRADYAIEIGRNVIHRSDSIESARKEIALWFPEGLSGSESNLY